MCPGAGTEGLAHWKKIRPRPSRSTKITKNQPTLVVAHKICMPSLNAADIGRRRNPACMQKLCRGRLHKGTSGVKLLLFLGVVVCLSRTHGPCDLKGGDVGGYLLLHSLKSCGS